jgi:hypothetical protein
MEGKMTKVTTRQLESKIRKGDWELDYEPNQFGLAQVIVTRNNARMTVRVVS